MEKELIKQRSLLPVIISLLPVQKKKIIDSLPVDQAPPDHRIGSGT